MATALMDDILRQQNLSVKKAVVSTLSGEIGKAFRTLGKHVSEAEPGKPGQEAAHRWLGLAGNERENAGVNAPTRALRDGINKTIRDNLIAEGEIHGRSRRGEKLVSLGLTGAEAAVAANYTAGDTVIFNRRYKTLGVEKGDERTVDRVDHRRHAVRPRDRDGVAIKKVFDRFNEALVGEESLHVSRFSYQDYRTESIPFGNALLPLVHKRISFQHEQEVHALYTGSPAEDATGGYCEVDLLRLVEEIVVAPFAEDWFVDFVGSLAERHGIGDRVRPSTLSDAPTFTVPVLIPES